MADRHRLGTFTNGRFTVALDLAPANGTWAVERDTFTITPPAQTDIKAHQNRRYGGSRRVAELHDNGNLAAQWFIKGANLQATLGQLDTLLAILESTTTTYYWEWRPDGATYSTYFEVRGTAWEPLYRWVQTAGTGHLHVKLGVDVAPLALGDQLDIADDFSVDTLTAGDYTFDTGAGTLAVASGALTASSVAEKRLYHSARGYVFTDAQVTLKVTPGASVAASHSTGLILRRIDANNFLWASVDDTNTLRIFKRVAGADTQLATVAYTPTAAVAFWVRLRTELNLVTAEAWNTEPTLSGTPNATVTYALSAAEAVTFGATVAGAAGARLIPKATDWTYDDFRVEPYTYKNRTLPDVIDLRSIPGSAPAQFALALGQPPSNPRVEPWGLVGWAARPAVHNLVWNGDLEDAVLATTGWAPGGTLSGVSLVNYLNASTTALSRVTTQAKFGTASLQVVAPGTLANEGAAFPMFRTFRKGVTYTFTGWARLQSGDGSWQVLGGNAAASDLATGGATVLTAAWAQISVTWTPTADTPIGVIALRHTAASASTVQIDGVQVFEGTVAPTLGRHGQGAGAYPPFGILPAEAAIPSTLSAFAVTANGGANGGYDIENASATGASAEWLIDPTLLAADDFTTELTVEVFARIASNATASSAVATLSAIPENNSGQRIYTAEWGVNGKTLILPSTGASWRMVRLGTMTFPVDPANPSRWRLKVALANAVATVAQLDYLLLVPARQRALGPTSKANDTTYPALFHVSGIEELKTIRADLSGRYSQPPGPAGRDPGLGGQLLELAPGDAQALLKLSDVVPDDPTSSTYAEAGTTVVASAHFAVQPRYLLTRTT